MDNVTGLPTNWLDMGSTTVQWETTTANDLVTCTDTLNWVGGHDWYEPCRTGQTFYYHNWPNWRETVKIRLTMSDVEKLRAAAKKDKAIKKVLQKIGPHIEVEVDF